MNSSELKSDQSLLTKLEIEFLIKLRERKAELTANIIKLKDEIQNVTTELLGLDTDDNVAIEKFNIGKNLFNNCCEKGIKYLINEKLILNDAKAVARFLFNANGLTKKSIGIYLGSNNQFNKQVLKEYISQQSFKDVFLIDALRFFLKQFLIPSESQIIDRIMEQFAIKYSEQNENLFKTKDDCYILCFGLIMLNTLFHNPKIKSKYKPTLENFLLDHKNIEKDLLIKYFENIRLTPFEFPQDDLNNPTLGKSVKQGWLLKQSRYGAHWDRRWFVLSNRCLYYFLNPTDKEPKGIIPLENVCVKELTSKNQNFGFEICSILGQNKSIKACKRDSDGRIITTKHITYKFATKDIQEEKNWFLLLKQNIAQNPYYDLLEARKRKHNKQFTLSSKFYTLRNNLTTVR